MRGGSPAPRAVILGGTGSLWRTAERLAAAGWAASRVAAAGRRTSARQPSTSIRAATTSTPPAAPTSPRRSPRARPRWPGPGTRPGRRGLRRWQGGVRACAAGHGERVSVLRPSTIQGAWVRQVRTTAVLALAHRVRRGDEPTVAVLRVRGGDVVESTNSTEVLARAVLACADRPRTSPGACPRCSTRRASRTSVSPCRRPRTRWSRRSAGFSTSEETPPAPRPPPVRRRSRW